MKRAVILVSALLVGCASELASTSSGKPAPHSSAGGPLPLRIGAQWTYLAHVNRVMNPDTIAIRIVDTATHPFSQRLAAHWHLNDAGLLLGFLPTSVWVTQASNSISDRDTVAFYWLLTDSIPLWTWVLPLEVGSAWTCRRCILLREPARVDGEVVSFGEVSTPEGIIKDAFHVRNRCSIFEPGWGAGPGSHGPIGQAGALELWVKPGVGIVSIRQSYVHTELSMPDLADTIVIEWGLLKYQEASQPESRLK